MSIFLSGLLDATKFAHSNSRAESAAQSNVRLPKGKNQTGEDPLYRNRSDCPQMMGQLFCLSYSIFLAVPCVMARAYANTILLPLFCIGNQACKVRNDFWAATSKCKHVLYALIEHSHTNLTQHSYTQGELSQN